MHMRRLLHSTVSAWRQHVDDKRQLAAMCARILGWHAQRRLRRMFAAWLELTQLEHLSKQQEQVTWHQQTLSPDSHTSIVGNSNHLFALCPYADTCMWQRLSLGYDATRNLRAEAKFERLGHTPENSRLVAGNHAGHAGCGC